VAGSLKNIRFKRFAARILSIEHISRVLIEWDLEPTTQNISNLYFRIFRSEDPLAMKEITATPIPAGTLNEYVDFTPRLLNLEKIYYYRVEAHEVTSGVTVQKFITPAFTWESELDLVGLYVVEEHLYAYRYVLGMPCLIFKKKTEGVRGANCDPILKRNVRSNNEETMGTPFVGGYYPPIPGWANFDPDPSNVQILEFGEKQIRQTDIMFTNYPTLYVGDIIVELKSFRFWRTTNCRSVEKNRTNTLQVARLDEINRSDIEYRLSIPEDVRSTMLKELEERIKVPEF
jgi:hypothetical protein